MFITAVCLLFLLKLKWPKNKNVYDFFRMLWFIGQIYVNRLIVLLVLKPTGITLIVRWGTELVANHFFFGSHVSRGPGKLGDETRISLFTSSLHSTPTIFQILPSPPLQLCV